MTLRPCLTCGALAHGSRCLRHKQRNGSTRQWRKLRARILARDRYACQLCGAPAHHVDHIHPVARGGSDQPANLRATCAECNLAKGDRLDRNGGRSITTTNRPADTRVSASFPPTRDAGFGV